MGGYKAEADARPPLPEGARAGEAVAFTDGRTRTGVVLDRAPQGYEYHPSVRATTFERSGVWLWVMTDDPRPEDGSFAVRVRYYSRGRRKGEAWRDDGPLCIPRRGGDGFVASVHDLYAEQREAIDREAAS